MHVFQYAPKHRYSVSVEWMSESIRKEAIYKLDEGKRDLQGLGVEAKTAMVEGDPVQQILGFAQTYQSPILVMGTHAVAGMERFLLGSTAEEVLRTARSPVVTVGPHVSFAAKDSPRIQKILLLQTSARLLWPLSHFCLNCGNSAAPGFGSSTLLIMELRNKRSFSDSSPFERLWHTQTMWIT